MTIIDISRDKEAADFAQKAAEDFRDHPNHYTYAEGDPKAGEFFAIRWNSFTVLVVRLHEDEQVRLYTTHQLIKSDLPRLQPC